MTLVKVNGPIPKKLTHKRKPSNRGTPAHKTYMEQVAKLHCCLGDRWGYECYGRTTVAHKDGAGMALKSSDYDTFPACVAHHLTGPHSIAEMGAKKWQRKYGPQDFWIAQTRLLIKH